MIDSFPPHMECSVAEVWNAIYDAMRYDTMQEIKGSLFVLFCGRPTPELYTTALYSLTSLVHTTYCTCR